MISWPIRGIQEGRRSGARCRGQGQAIHDAFLGMQSVAVEGDFPALGGELVQAVRPALALRVEGVEHLRGEVEAVVAHRLVGVVDLRGIGAVDLGDLSFRHMVDVFNELLSKINNLITPKIRKIEHPFRIHV